jgi:hypothetical protein
MKTEEQIRRHIKALVQAVTPDCQCPDCLGNMSAAGALQWALGDLETLNPELEEIIADFVANNA